MKETKPCMVEKKNLLSISIFADVGYRKIKIQFDTETHKLKVIMNYSVLVAIGSGKIEIYRELMRSDDFRLKSK